MIGRTPLYDGLKYYQSVIKSRYMMPGHQNLPGAAEVLRELALLTPFDVTETPLTGDLMAGEGIVAEAERAAGELYGAKSTVFSAGGATLCVNAALLLAGKPGGKILLDRRSHRSMLHTMILLDQKPVYLYPEENTIAGRLLPSDVDKALEADQEISAVAVTSPSYYGIIEPVEKLAAVCHRHHVPLLVDNSHGGHLIAVQNGRYHPIRLGADLCIDSLHKTLPCLTGGAMLHSKLHSSSALKDAMRLFGSSSPSYLILTALDLCVGYLKTDAEQDIRQATALVARAAARIEGSTPLRVLSGGESDGRTDPLRLTLLTENCSMDGNELYRRLLAMGICAEMADASAVVLIVSPLVTEKEIFNLAEIICHMQMYPTRKQNSASVYFRLAQALSPRAAHFADKREIAVSDSVGKIIGQTVTPYPPGIPLATEGERISPELAGLLAEDHHTILIIDETEEKR